MAKKMGRKGEAILDILMKSGGSHFGCDEFLEYVLENGVRGKVMNGKLKKCGSN